jgi:hypothetical protein
MAKKNNGLVLIIFGVVIIAVALFLFKKMMGQDVLIFPGQGFFSVKPWQNMPNGTQIGIGIIGAVLLIFGIVKRK